MSHPFSGVTPPMYVTVAILFLISLSFILIPIQLPQPNSSHDVSHVALVPRANDVIFPRPNFALRQRILVLTVEGEELIHLVDFGISNSLVDGGGQKPSTRATLGGSKILPSWSVGITPRCRQILWFSVPTYYI